MILSIMNVLLQATLCVWAFLISVRGSSKRHKEHHLRGFSAVAAVGIVTSLASAWSNQKNENRLNAPYCYPERVGSNIGSDGTFTVHAEVRNRGKTPAYNAHGLIVLFDIGANETTPDLSYNENEARNRATLMPDGYMYLQTYQPFPAAEVKRFLDRGDHIYLVGSLWYQDTHHQKMENAYCYELVQNSLWEARSAHTCKNS